MHEQSADKDFNGWEQEMKTLLVQANEEVRQACASLAPDRQDWFGAQWDGLLERGEDLHPKVKPEGYCQGKTGPTQTGQRVQPAQTPARLSPGSPAVHDA